MSGYKIFSSNLRAFLLLNNFQILSIQIKNSTIPQYETEYYLQTPEKTELKLITEYIENINPKLVYINYRLEYNPIFSLSISVRILENYFSRIKI